MGPGHPDAPPAVAGGHRGVEAVAVGGEHGRPRVRPQGEVGPVLVVEVTGPPAPAHRDHGVVDVVDGGPRRGDPLGAVAGQESEPRVGARQVAAHADAR